MINLITKNKLKKSAVAILLFATSNGFSQSYNTLWIPDTLSGTTLRQALMITCLTVVVHSFATFLKKGDDQ